MRGELNGDERAAIGVKRACGPILKLNIYITFSAP